MNAHQPHVDQRDAALSDTGRPDSARPHTDQHVDMQWETPTYDEIPAISKMHVAGMEMTDDDAVWVVAGMHHVVLHTTGRRSGAEHKVALPIWRDAEGHRIVVASFAGHPHDPAWFLNLCDTAANPAVRVCTQHSEYWSTPEVLDGDDHASTWSALTADRAWYGDYQARTARHIPLVRLPEPHPA